LADKAASGISFGRLVDFGRGLLRFVPAAD